MNENKKTALTQREKFEAGKKLIKSEAFKNAISEVLPRHLTPDRMARTAIMAMTTTPDLALCTKESFIKCMMELSQLGIEPDGRRAHLIPFNNRRVTPNRLECTLMLDYKGIVFLIMQTGLVSTIHTDIVCDNDVFKYNIGRIEAHEIDFKKDRGKPYAAYSIITMKDGSQKCEVMNKEQIEDIRKRSKSPDSPAWTNDYDEMAKKTVFRRASKWVPWNKENKEVEVEKAFSVSGVVGDISDGPDLLPENTETPENTGASDNTLPKVGIFIKQMQAIEEATGWKCERDQDDHSKFNILMDEGPVSVSIFESEGAAREWAQDNLEPNLGYGPSSGPAADDGGE